MARLVLESHVIYRMAPYPKKRIAPVHKEQKAQQLQLNGNKGQDSHERGRIGYIFQD